MGTSDLEARRAAIDGLLRIVVAVVAKNSFKEAQRQILRDWEHLVRRYEEDEEVHSAYLEELKQQVATVREVFR